MFLPFGLTSFEGGIVPCDCVPYLSIIFSKLKEASIWQKEVKKIFRHAENLKTRGHMV